MALQLPIPPRLPPVTWRLPWKEKNKKKYILFGSALSGGLLVPGLNGGDNGGDTGAPDILFLDNTAMAFLDGTLAEFLG